MSSASQLLESANRWTQLLADLRRGRGSTSSVSTAPGSTSETRTWRSVISWRSDSLNAPTPCLVSVVDAAAEARAAAGDRADVDEVGDAARLVLGGREQMRERGVGDVEQALEVERDHPVPLLDRRVDDRAEQHHAGVVDDDVEPAELGDGALDGGDRLVAVGDVGLDREPAELAGERVEPVLAPRGERPPARPGPPAPGPSPRRSRCSRP